MSRRRGNEGPSAGERVAHTTRPPASPDSGVVRKEDVDAQLASALAEPPPWHVVCAYLARGEHAEWVEACAAASRPFAEVLAALRNDREERRAARRGVLLPFRR